MTSLWRILRLGQRLVESAELSHGAGDRGSGSAAAWTGWREARPRWRLSRAEGVEVTVSEGEAETGEGLVEATRPR